MYDYAIEEGEENSGGNYCYADYDRDTHPCPADNPYPCACGINYVSQFYFVIFNVIAAFVLINVVVAGVLMSYQAAKGIFDSGLTDQMITRFKIAWHKFDPDADGRMDCNDLPDFVEAVKPIFGFDDTLDVDRLKRGLSDAGGEYRFTNVLYVLAFEKFGVALGVSTKGLKLEQRLQNRQLLVDGDNNPKKQPIIAKLSEYQVKEMTVEGLRDELRRRGFVRKEQRLVRARTETMAASGAMRPLEKTYTEGEAQAQRQSLEE